MTNANIFDNIDVICEMKATGEIVPMRLKFPDEDGSVHEYNIKGIKRLNNDKVFRLPDAGYQRCNFTVFLCRIVVFGRMTEIILYYDRSKSRWSMCPNNRS